MNINFVDYYTAVNLPISITDNIKEFIELNETKFFISDLKQHRINFNSTLLSQIMKFVPFKISDCGVFKNVPKWEYPMHKDKFRQCALNMILVDNDNEFESLIHDESGRQIGKIPYVKNQWILLNTKKFHSVKNNSSTLIRFVVSIGCTTENYYTIRDRLISI